MQYVTSKSEALNTPIWIFSKKAFGDKITDAKSLIANIRAYYTCGIPNRETISSRQSDYSTNFKYFLPFLIRSSTASLTELVSYQVENILESPDMIGTIHCPKNLYAAHIDKMDATVDIVSTTMYGTWWCDTFANNERLPVKFDKGTTVYFGRFTETDMIQTSQISLRAGQRSGLIPQQKGGLMTDYILTSSTRDKTGRDCILSTSAIQGTISPLRLPTKEEYMADGTRTNRNLNGVIGTGVANLEVHSNVREGDLTELIGYQTDGTNLVVHEDFVNKIQVTEVTSALINTDQTYLRRVKTKFDQEATQIEL